MEQTIKTCFDSEVYIKKQREIIQKRIKKFGKLYMEFGGKLFDDLHASRVLPGFDPNVQIRLLDSFKDDCEILFVISAKDIEKHKVRADFGITYDMEVLRLIEKLRKRGLCVSAIVITLFEGEQSAMNFRAKLEAMGERVFYHYFTKGYPTDVETIVSEAGYGRNPYIETTKNLVAITAPGPGSGKLATCLSQLYHEYKRGKKAGYAKFEKFPVWNLPLKHPINVAYESATADLGDKNVIDSYHYDAYHEIAVSYNRDLEAFPVVRTILQKITGEDIYKSPTDMGINTIASCITDDKLVRYSAKQEIIRRYLRAKVDAKKNIATKYIAENIRLLMNELNITVYDRPCVKPAEEKFLNSHAPAMAIELLDGRVVTGRKTDLLSAPASAILNALKAISNIDDSVDLIQKMTLEPIVELRQKVFRQDNTNLTLKETLVALCISATFDKNSQKAYENLKFLRGCNAHSTHILTTNNEETLRNLGINLTCGDKFLVGNLFDM